MTTRFHRARCMVGGAGWRARTGSMLLGAASIVLFVGAGATHTQAQGPTGPPLVLEHSRDASSVVVQYREILGEIGDADRGPTLTVYGDGRAVAHYPAYMTRRGDHTIRLSPDELNGLLSSLAANGVLDFDTAAARAAKRDAAAARRDAALGGAAEQVHVSDASTTVIEVRLDRYQPAGAAAAAGLQKEVIWYGVREDARHYPNIQAIRGLAAAEQELRGLMERPDLAKVD